MSDLLFLCGATVVALILSVLAMAFIVLLKVLFFDRSPPPSTPPAHPDQQLNHDANPVTFQSIDCERAALVVLVRDLGSDYSIEIHGRQVQQIAYAAAYLSAIAARACPDGFERGLEYLQSDAVAFASGRFGEISGQDQPCGE